MSPISIPLILIHLPLLLSPSYTPLHWAVNQDEPNVDVVAALIAANASACSKPCLKGSLPLHWLVNRDQPFMPVVRALLQVRDLSLPPSLLPFSAR